MRPLIETRWFAVLGLSLMATVTGRLDHRVGAQEVDHTLTLFMEELIEVTPGTDPFPREFQYRQLGDEAGTKIVMERSFKVSAVEVTQELWNEVMGENPSRWKGNRNSVENLSFAQAVDFCQKLTERLHEAKLLEPTEMVRLPSEIEWEYTARADGVGDFTFGNDRSLLNDYAWHTGNAAGNDPPVAAKKPNAWGLFDVHGYLSEWCLTSGEKAELADHHSVAWSEVKETEQAVVRSGSWKDAADGLRLGVRRELPPATRDDAIGLRCVVVERTR